MKTLVVGIGSPIRRDDGVGVHAIRRLQERALPADVELVELGTGGMGLLDYIDGHQRLVIVDAMETGADPGTLHDLRGDEIRRANHCKAIHDVDLPSALQLGRDLLGRDMPEEVFVVGVEIEDLATFSESLSPAVEAAMPEVLARVEALVGVS